MVYQAWIQWAVVSPQHMDNKKNRAMEFCLGRRFVENSCVGFYSDRLSELTWHQRKYDCAKTQGGALWNLTNYARNCSQQKHGICAIKSSIGFAAGTVVATIETCCSL